MPDPSRRPKGDVGLLVVATVAITAGALCYALKGADVFLATLEDDLRLLLSILPKVLAGVLLAGYSSKGYQAMGDPYLLPAIAAVVLGGTHILGGRGSYLGTIAGVILISLLASILSVMQMPEAGRQIIYGSVIVGMLLVYGRGQKVLG